jgi:hypothetical protein
MRFLEYPSSNSILLVKRIDGKIIKIWEQVIQKT